MTQVSKQQAKFLYWLLKEALRKEANPTMQVPCAFVFEILDQLSQGKDVHYTKVVSIGEALPTQGSGLVAGSALMACYPPCGISSFDHMWQARLYAIELDVPPMSIDVKLWEMLV